MFFWATLNGFGEYYNVLCIDNIRSISSLKKTKQYENLDISEEANPTEMIKLSINTQILMQ